MVGKAMKRMVMQRIVVVPLVLLPWVAQSPAAHDSGFIAGTVQGEDGSTVAGPYVTLRLAHTPAHTVQQRFQTQWGVAANEDGTFRFSGLAHGSYRLCVFARDTAWLDPCHWGPAIPSVTLRDGESSRTLAIPLAKGTEVPIQIDDPGRVLFLNEGRTKGAHLLTGVRTAGWMFVPAAPVSREDTAARLKVVIPYETLVDLTVASSFFRLAHGDGAEFAKPGGALLLFAARDRSPVTVRLLVTGRN
jgi:hypothetical protein